MTFCNRWLTHRDHVKAFKEAGFHDGGRSGDALKMLHKYRQYLERRQPKIEIEVAKRIAYERADILAAISNIGNANALDYIEPYNVVNPETQIVEQRMQLKALDRLTREQAAAVESVTWDKEAGVLTYQLPSVQTKLKALTTLGEQAANFKLKGASIHNHLHLGDSIPMEEILAAKAMLVNLVGPEASREILGWSESDQEAAG